MRALLKYPSASLGLFTLLAFLSLSKSAFADGPDSPTAPHELDFVALNREGDAADTIETPLPTQLADWSDASDGLELRYPMSISLAEFPQGRLSQKPPFIDFGKFELGGGVGAVDYSSKFKANASYTVDITGRVPAPGIPLGEWGFWAEVGVSYINRKLAFYYNNQHSNWYEISAGADYTFVRDNLWYLRGELGVLYAYWNGVNALDNGIGAVAGLQAGFYWIKNYTKSAITLTPQISYDGKNWIGFFTIGFLYDF